MSFSEQVFSGHEGKNLGPTSEVYPQQVDNVNVTNNNIVTINNVYKVDNVINNNFFNSRVFLSLLC